jgi:hypothetical protein
MISKGWITSHYKDNFIKSSRAISVGQCASFTLIEKTDPLLFTSRQPHMDTTPSKMITILVQTKGSA